MKATTGGPRISPTPGKSGPLEVARHLTDCRLRNPRKDVSRWRGLPARGGKELDKEQLIANIELPTAASYAVQKQHHANL